MKNVGETMTSKSWKAIDVSKFMSLVLRHEPQKVGLSMNSQGWVSFALLVEKLQKVFPGIEAHVIEEIVRSDEKRRYAISDGMIRANQGHSLKLDGVEFAEKAPPQILFHGTTLSAWKRIQAQGEIARMQRHHVHLSADEAGAVLVAKRRNDSAYVLLEVRAQEMRQEGYVFFQSENGVWLTHSVPVRFIRARELR